MSEQNIKINKINEPKNNEGGNVLSQLHPFAVYNNAERIRDVIRYVQRFKNALIVVHIDSEIIGSPFFASHIRDICLIHEAGLRVLIVPGAKKRIDEVLSSAKISWQINNGIRITDADAMPYIKTAAFDVANQVMTSFAGERQTAVIGNWVRARGVGIVDGTDFATAGEIDKIQIDAVKTVLNEGFIPIFPCIGWSATGKPYNISSMQLAAETAVHLKADKLFFLTSSVSITPENFIIPVDIGLSPEGCVPAMNMQELNLFMKANMPAENKNDFSKRSAALKTLELAGKSCVSGVSRVHILNGSLDGAIPCEIFSNFGSGTMIYESDYGGIRQMTPNDISAVLTLIRPFVEKGILLPRSEQVLAETYKNYIVYELDGGIRACAAFIEYENDNEAQFRQAEIAAVAVDTACAHAGIGQKLIKCLSDAAAKKGYESVFVLTTQTADWFEKMGFTEDSLDSLPPARKRIWSAERGSKVFRLKL
ncbi:MAG: amino-acid N-acetyltransferase [Bacteroides sp.]|nr:amino-acid N-acetyltransferase [Prevotella sp.]MCM1408825.1 amino-acid N-acetyltransferase [Treponema brennaborense]MCM1470605.1 amino-acid N-acetyltransferase [Bacteroides sp.]